MLLLELNLELHKKLKSVKIILKVNTALLSRLIDFERHSCFIYV